MQYVIIELQEYQCSYGNIIFLLVDFSFLQMCVVTADIIRHMVFIINLRRLKEQLVAK